MQHLERLAVMSPHAHFESADVKIRVVDDATYFETVDLTDENSMFHRWRRPALDDELSKRIMVLWRRARFKNRLGHRWQQGASFRMPHLDRQRERGCTPSQDPSVGFGNDVHRCRTSASRPDQRCAEASSGAVVEIDPRHAVVHERRTHTDGGRNFDGVGGEMISHQRSQLDSDELMTSRCCARIGWFGRHDNEGTGEASSTAM